MFILIAEVIRKNLETLRENVEKKKRAQDAYYENHSENFGMSPLTREAHKKPVKQRLGRTNIPYAGTSTSFLPPKQRLRKVNNTFNNIINSRKTRFNIAQQRISRIRATNQENFLNQSVKKIRLRRPVSIINGEPKNFQVQVVNNTAHLSSKYNSANSPRIRRFRQILNAGIQMEIKKLQLQFTGSNIQPSNIIPAFTLKTLNDRFARLK